MSLEKMSYKDYVWEYNPSQISVDEEKNIKDIKCPYYKNVLQNFGRAKRIVKGSGEFFGENFLEKFNKLREVYLSDETGYLKLPGEEPFLASFKSLKMLGNKAEDSLSYSFEFWESIEKSGIEVASLSESYYTASKGENLWNIAYKYNTTVSELMKINPEIKRPDSLEDGQRVVLR